LQERFDLNRVSLIARHGRFLTPGFTPLKLKLKLNMIETESETETAGLKTD